MPHASGSGTIRGRWTRIRRLQGEQCGAICEPPRRVEKKVKAKGMESTQSLGTERSALAVIGHCSAIPGRR
eukprot:scaffold118542_cov36-Tisochrysis_lutea.AAC.1